MSQSLGDLDAKSWSYKVGGGGGGRLLSPRSPSCPDGLADILKVSPGKGSLTPGFVSLEGTLTSGSPPLQEMGAGCPPCPEELLDAEYF